MEHRFTIAVDHPALPGHFPGNPIVPGVVLLDEIASALQQLQPKIKVSGLPNAKFLSPLRAGECCTVRFSPGRNGSMKFECATEDRPIANGSLALEENP